PQHLTVPVFVTAQVELNCVAIDSTPLVSPTTSTGVLRVVVVPSPSWPLKLMPQHLTPPAVVSAQVNSLPAMIWVTPLDRPTTSTGVVRGVALVPSPSWPVRFSPQHLTPPALVSAQLCSPPA